MLKANYIEYTVLKSNVVSWMNIVPKLDLSAWSTQVEYST